MTKHHRYHDSELYTLTCLVTPGTVGRQTDRLARKNARVVRARSDCLPNMSRLSYLNPWEFHPPTHSPEREGRPTGRRLHKYILTRDDVFRRLAPLVASGVLGRTHRAAASGRKDQVPLAEGCSPAVASGEACAKSRAPMLPGEFLQKCSR